MTKWTGPLTAIADYTTTIGTFADYIDAFAPAVLRQPRDVLPVFTESLVVLTVARFEQFLKSLTGTACHEREVGVRQHFQHHGNDEERRSAGACDVPALVRMVKRRVGFKAQGRGAERMFDLLFGFPLWPNATARDVVVDLVFIRNVLVHEGETVVSEHVKQIHRANLVIEEGHGPQPVYDVNHPQVLILVRDAMEALGEQADHIRKGLLARGSNPTDEQTGP